MLLDTAAGASPAFLTPNYLNRHAHDNGVLTATSGQSLVYRLFDMDRLSLFSSLGSDDATPEVIEFELWQAGGQTMRQLDTILILNHNVKKIKIETSANNGASWTTRLDIDNITANYTRFNQAALFDADRVRITLYTTQIANQEKLVGIIYVGAAVFQAAEPPQTLTRKPPRVGHKTAMLADGSIRRAFIYRSDASYKFYGVTMAYAFVSADERARLRALAYGGGEFRLVADATERARLADFLFLVEFVFMPEPGDEPLDAFLCQVVPETFVDNYTTQNQASGYTVTCDVEEIGGA